MKTIEVEGISSGDMERWCLEVDEATYRRVCGDEEADQEVLAKVWEDEPDRSTPIIWRLYPDDLIGYGNSGSRIRLTVAGLP